MVLRTIVLAAAIVLAQPSFAQTPVPAEKSAYVGVWTGDKMRLRIYKEGKVEYKVDRPGKRMDLTVDLQGFEGDSFNVGLPFLRSTFVVSKPPHLEHGKWVMVVDGVKLTREE
jgi:hypothetical protein